MQYRRAFWIVGLLSLVTLISTIGIVRAQSDALALSDPQTVQISAADGLNLAGDYYASPDLQLPTVLLLHGLNGNRGDWAESIEVFWQAGYNILAVDLRGHGDTGGEQNWEAAVADAQTWLDWIYEQPEVQATGVSIIGADLGGNLALIGCENDSNCVTAIAVSAVAIGCGERDCSVEVPGLDEAAIVYVDETTSSTVTDADRRSSASMLFSLNDELSLESIRAIGKSRADQVELVGVSQGGRGTELLSQTPVQERVIHWLDGHTPPNLTDEEIEALVAAGDLANGETLFAEGVAGVPLEEGAACSRCHYADSEEKKRAPGLLNIGERAATRVEGQSAAVYLYYSIVAPDRYLVEGFSGGNMPPRFDKGYTEEEIADIVAYLLTLESD